MERQAELVVSVERALGHAIQSGTMHIRDLLDFLAYNDLDAVRRLGDMRGVGGRSRDDKCEALARSYRGDYEQFVQDLRKSDLVCLLESPTEVGGGEYYLPSANRFAKEELEEFATAVFRDERIPEQFKGDGPRQGGREKSKPIKDTGEQPRNVFLVHGHDESLLLRVQNFLHRLGLNPIVLHDQLNRGGAIIEKLVREAKGAHFAIILLSPDDKGCKASEDDLKPRARQNIVFEWGLFVGLLGREKVCALRNGAVEMPSDLDGVVWEAVEGHWEARVAKEMRAAGLPVDLNRL